MRVLVLGGTGFIGHHRSEEHTSELQSRPHLVCRLLLEKKSICCRSCCSNRVTLASCALSWTSIPANYVDDFFFFNNTATTEISPLSLHDPLPILPAFRFEFGFHGIRHFACRTLALFFL